MHATTMGVSFESFRSLESSPARRIDTIGTRTFRLEGRQINSDPQLMDESHRLRYQVYCLERGFLNPADYPNRRECDEFDPYSLHLGVTAPEGSLLATARLVKVNTVGFPLFRHCRLYPRELDRFQDMTRVAEISRLCVSRNLRRPPDRKRLGRDQPLSRHLSGIEAEWRHALARGHGAVAAAAARQSQGSLQGSRTTDRLLRSCCSVSRRSELVGQGHRVALAPCLALVPG